MLINPFSVFIALGRTLEILFNFFIVAGFIVINIILIIVYVLAIHILLMNDDD